MGLFCDRETAYIAAPAGCSRRWGFSPERANDATRSERRRFNRSRSADAGRPGERAGRRQSSEWRGQSRPWLLGHGAWLGRRRLRRHRHEPALRAQGLAGAHQADRHACDGNRRDRLAADLGADLHRHRQVRAVHHARRQQGRRRHALADGACAARGWQAHHADLPARRRRRSAVFGRRDHHAGDLGPLGDRGPETARRAPVRRFLALYPADHHRDPDLAVHGAEPRHGQGRCPVRPDHGSVLRHARDARRDPHFRRARHPARDQSGQRPDLPDLERRPELHHARPRLPCGHRRRGAVRGHGPFWPQADPARLGFLRPALADPQLSRPGRLHPRPSLRGDA